MPECSWRWLRRLDARRGQDKLYRLQSRLVLWVSTVLAGLKNVGEKRLDDVTSGEFLVPSRWGAIVI